MEKTSLIWVAQVFIILFSLSANAQIRRPAPTGQIPKTYSGQSGNPYSGYQPKPTGQIAPAQPVEVPSQQGYQVAQPGQVPKATTTQDPITQPERYQATPASQTEEITTYQRTQVIPAPATQPETGYQTQPTANPVPDQQNQSLPNPVLPATNPPSQTGASRSAPTQPANRQGTANSPRTNISPASSQKVDR
jgi:hypothetical protein